MTFSPRPLFSPHPTASDSCFVEAIEVDGELLFPAIAENEPLQCWTLERAVAKCAGVIEVAGEEVRAA